MKHAWTMHVRNSALVGWNWHSRVKMSVAETQQRTILHLGRGHVLQVRSVSHWTCVKITNSQVFINAHGVTTCTICTRAHPQTRRSCRVEKKREQHGAYLSRPTPLCATQWNRPNQQCCLYYTARKVGTHMCVHGTFKLEIPCESLCAIAVFIHVLLSQHFVWATLVQSDKADENCVSSSSAFCQWIDWPFEAEKLLCCWPEIANFVQQQLSALQRSKKQLSSSVFVCVRSFKNWIYLRTSSHYLRLSSGKSVTFSVIWQKGGSVDR